MKNIKQPKRRVINEKQTLSHLDGTEKVLEETKKSMHYEEIANVAIKKGWIKSSAKNPARSVYNTVYADVKKGNSRFLLDDRTGKISLAKWEGNQVISKIEEHNVKTKKKLLVLLKKMDPTKQFEPFIAEVFLPGIGFENCHATQVTKDEGIDARGRLSIMDAVFINVGVQIKRWNNKIPPAEIQKLRGALKPQEQGLFVTTSTFTKQARKEADAEGKTRINLIDGEKLVDILTTMDWSAEERGVRIEKRNLIILDEEYFKNYGD